MPVDWYKDFNNSSARFSAFDVIDHKLFLEKLQINENTEYAIAWMESHLKQRSQKVFFNRDYSDSMYIGCVSSQGSCLALLM